MVETHVPEPTFSIEEIKKIVAQIPTFAEIESQNLYSKLDEDKNYQFEIAFKGNPQKLYYFGSNHSIQDTNPQYAKLRSLMGKFAGSVKPVNIVEGGVYPIDEEFLDTDVIAKYSETGFVLWNSKQTKTPCVSYELKGGDEVDALIQSGFKASDLRMFYFSRLFRQVSTNDLYKAEIQNYINAGLAILREKGIIKVNDIYSKCKKEFEELESTTLTIDPSKANMQKLEKYSFPTDDNVAGYLSKIRDARVVIGASHLWSLGYSPFITYGAAYAIREEQVLRKLITVPSEDD